MLKYYTIIGGFVLFLIIISGCGNSAENANNVDDNTGALIQISKQQFESDSMRIGKVEMQFFEDEIKCTGHILASEKGIAQISTPLSGTVLSINIRVGDYIKKGQVVCTVTSHELISIQQDYAETSSRLKRLKSDYERNKVLFAERIGAEKDFIAIESEYRAMKSKYQSLKLRLELLHFNASTIENGELYSSFPVIAPINGFITQQNLVLGQFVEQQNMMMEVTDVTELRLQLSVFEKDISKLKIGQQVKFRAAGEIGLFKEAVLISIGKAINPETRTIPCIAQIKDGDLTGIINRTYVESTIVVSKNETNALPNEAILKSGKDYFVFIIAKTGSQDYSLRKQRITIGRTSLNYSEITGTWPKEEILVQGGYNLSSE